MVFVLELKSLLMLLFPGANATSEASESGILNEVKFQLKVIIFNLIAKLGYIFKPEIFANVTQLVFNDSVTWKSLKGLPRALWWNLGRVDSK